MLRSTESGESYTTPIITPVKHISSEKRSSDEVGELGWWKHVSCYVAICHGMELFPPPTTRADERTFFSRTPLTQIINRAAAVIAATAGGASPLPLAVAAGTADAVSIALFPTAATAAAAPNKFRI